MLSGRLNSLLFATVAVAVTLVALPVARSAAAAPDQTCDVAADAALGSEDYVEAIRLHKRMVAIRPDDALAHYHLGFAYGMTGQRDKELLEYRRAANLGLRQWDLYVNLGRAYLESGDYPAATEALETATTLGPAHPEAHFNLGLAYERQRIFALAEAEMRTALRLGAEPAEADNMLAIIYAEQGRRAEARRVWTDLIKAEPGSTAARTNLAILDRPDQRTASAASSTPASVAYAKAQP